MASAAASLWEKRVLANSGLVEELARNRFVQKASAEAALRFVQAAMQENDWQRLRSFKGESSVRTFLVHVTLQCLEDFARDTCGGREAEGSAIDTEASVARPGTAPVDELPPGTVPSEGDPQALWKAFRLGLGLADAARCATAPDQALRFLEELGKDVRLSVEEALFLRLVFQDGLKVGAAGRLLGWGGVVAHSRRKRLLTRLQAGVRAALLRCGVERNDLRALFG